LTKLERLSRQHTSKLKYRDAFLNLAAISPRHRAAKSSGPPGFNIRIPSRQAVLLTAKSKEGGCKNFRLQGRWKLCDAQKASRRPRKHRIPRFPAMVP
jgi:hypothetical protein